MTMSASQTAEPPPGVRSTMSASPAQTNDIASVTTMSGTRVMTTSEPLTAPSSRPSARTPRTTMTPNSSLWPFIWEAATTLVNAIIDPIERSIPPEITMIACAAAASASGRTELASPWIPATP